MRLTDSLVCFVVCEDALPLLLNGDVICSDENAVDSVCKYVCNHGFALQGEHASTCLDTTEGTRWSDASPICLPGEIICQ